MHVQTCFAYSTDYLFLTLSLPSRLWISGRDSHMKGAGRDSHMKGAGRDSHMKGAGRDSHMKGAGRDLRRKK